MRRRDFLGAATAPLLARAPLAAAPVSAPVAAAAAAPAVTVGLERLASDKRSRLKGLRIGLVCHAASVTADGRHAIDVLASSGARVVRLFGPEHGLRGQAAAGEKVASGVDAATGIAVVSLYGERRKPTREDLAGLEALVIDLQDAGVRFYTYASTMLLCLEAAAEAGVEAIVLDRPNPLGGVRVEGPEREAGMPLSMVSRAPGPLVHGLTLGEMARLVNERGGGSAGVSAVARAGWTRGMTWAETGRAWVDPSPNLRSPEAALAYPGTCLVEATNASEGRGTEAPFLLVGAPWVKPDELARDASTAGFVLEPTAFKPRASPAAPQPKLKDELCHGVRVRVKDAATASAWALGLRLLVALRRQPGFAWVREGAWLDTLTGTKAVRAAIERGDSVDKVLAAEGPGIARWRRERKASLLY